MGKYKKVGVGGSYTCICKTKWYTAVKCVRNLCGHSIGRYKIHSGRALPIVATDDNTKMMVGIKSQYQNLIISSLVPGGRTVRNRNLRLHRKGLRC